MLVNCSQTKLVGIILVLWSFYDSQMSIGILQVFTVRRIWIVLVVFFCKICSQFEVNIRVLVFMTSKRSKVRKKSNLE